MPARNPTDLLSGHLALYTYLEPLWRGRNVLEVGCHDGARAAHLAASGAGRVVAVDRDRGAIDRARVRFRRPRLEYRAVTSWADLGSTVTGSFDVIVVPDGELLLHESGLIPRLRAVMSSLGRLVVAVRSAERHSPFWRGGVGYYELVDTLSAHFARVKMFGQTPFLGFGLVEFEGSPEAVRVETALVDSGESPCDYVAIAGVDDGPSLGYALVQVPFSTAEEHLSVGVEKEGREAAGANDAAGRESLRQAEVEVERLNREVQSLRARAATIPSGDMMIGWEARLVQADRRADEAERRGRARAEEDDGRVNEARRKLETAWSDAEAAQRIARAQASEIDELRARVRRANEDRAAQDGELATLRRALTEADESVVRLTRRTAEEMSVVAQRLSAGLLGTEEGAAERSKVTQQLAAAEEQIVTLRAAVAEAEGRATLVKSRLDEALARLAKAEDAARQLPARDDRIALLEGEKQDLTWRLSEAESALARAPQSAQPAIAKAPLGASLPAPPAPRAAATPPPEPLVSPARLAELEAELTLLRSARDRAVEEFHKVSAAHLQEVHRLRGQVAEQAALANELEDQVRVAEGRAATAEKEVASARTTAKSLDDADRARRSRLSELEGKLLRLQHEKKQAVEGDTSVEQLWQQRLQTSEQRAVMAVQQVAQAAEVLARNTEELAALREENRRLGEEAKASALAEETAKASSETAHAAVAAAVAKAEAASLAPLLPAPAPALSGETRRALFAIEERLLEEAREVATLEATVSSLEGEVRARGTLTVAERALSEERLAEKDSALERQRQELAQVRRELELVASQASSAARLPLVAEISQEGVQVQLMHNTLTNIRRRAARLRDEVEGYRRRAEGLSAGAMSSILEEIGEDLAEFAKA